MSASDHHDHDHSDIVSVAGQLPGMTFYPREHRPRYLQPLEEPDWLPAPQAAHMLPDDFVLGLPLEQHAYAMPWWVMKNHHVANLVLEGRPFLITLCENCSSACAFDPVVDGQRLTFQVAGQYHGTIYIDDAQTQSGWAPFAGNALYGPLAGRQLQPYPLYQCTWQEWLELHPETLVLSGDGESRDGHGAGVAPGTLESKMVKKIERDRRLRPNVLVLGVTVGDAGKAYPIEVLPVYDCVVNDEISGVPVVIFGREGSLLSIAFSRVAGDRVLSFERIQDLRFRDRETGSEWNFEGVAVSGPLQGHRLTFVPSAVEEWYAFAAARERVDVFEMNRVRAAWGQKVKSSD